MRRLGSNNIHNKSGLYDHMNKCLILGAGGFIGRSLCRQLHKDYHIVAYDKYFPQELYSMENIEFVQGDFVSEQNFGYLLRDIKIVIHLISTTIPVEGTNNIFREIDENIRPSACLLEAISNSSIERFVFSSSGGTVYGDTNSLINKIDSPHNPRSTYGLQKSIIEKMILFYSQKYQFRACIMRITNPYGIGQDSQKPQGVIPILLRKLYLHEPVTIYGDQNTRDYIYMSDLMNAFEKVLSYNGSQSCFNIGTGINTTVPELIAHIERISGKKFADIYHFPSRSSDVTHTHLNVEDSWLELGWKPSVSLDEGIRRILDYYYNDIVVSHNG